MSQWSASIHLTKTASGFEGTTKIPWGQKIKYKFVVDGQWVTHEDQPTETDPGGFVNNVFTAPPKPAELEPAPATEDPVALETPVKEAEVPVTNGHATNGHTVATEVTEDKPAEPAAQEEAAASGPEDKEGENNTSAAPNVEPKHPAGYPRLLSDLADTIAARDGTSSALDYVASGLGAVVHSVVGVDPINAQKVKEIFAYLVYFVSISIYSTRPLLLTCLCFSYLDCDSDAETRRRIRSPRQSGVRAKYR